MYINDDYFPIYYQESTQMKNETFVRIMVENMSFGVPDSFKNATSKILVTVGEKERKIMKESFVQLINSNPNSEGVIFPNIGHGASLAQPEFFNKVIESWIEQKPLPSQIRLYNSSTNTKGDI